MRRRVLAASVLLALPLVGCSGDGGRDDTFVLQLDGAAEVRGERGSERLEGGRHRLSPGDELRVTDGSATLGLPGDSSLELRAGRRRSTDSVLEVGVVPTLIDGYALLVADGDEGRVRAGAATVSLRDGAARVRRSTGVSVGVYDGDAVVAAHGLERDVPALRQLSVSDASTIPRRAAPLVFDRENLDPWDRRYLGGAVALGAELDRLSAAVTRRVPLGSTTGAALREVVPALADEAVLDRVQVPAGRTTGETVVGASIAAGADGEFLERWEAVFDFREQGADWGLVALDQEAGRDDVVAVLDSVLEEAVDGPIVVAAPTLVGPTGTTAGPAAPAPTPTTAPPAPPPSTTPPPSAPEEPEPTSPTPPPPPPLLEPIEGLLGPAAESTGTVVATLTESVGGLLAG